MRWTGFNSQPNLDWLQSQRHFAVTRFHFTGTFRMSTILPGWTSAATAGDGSPVRSIPPVNPIDKEADQFPDRDGVPIPPAPDSGPVDRDWTGGSKGPSQTDRHGGEERK
jgi:hypothetical protein